MSSNESRSSHYIGRSKTRQLARRLGFSFLLCHGLSFLSNPAFGQDEYVPQPPIEATSAPYFSDWQPPSDLAAPNEAPYSLSSENPVGVPTGYAAEGPTDVSAELEVLKRRLSELENAQKASASKGDSKGADSKSGDKKASGKDAAKPADSSKDIPKDKWNIKLGGHVQLDYVNWTKADPAIPNTQDYFEYRRLRLVADGVGYENLDFRLQMTLEPETVGENLPGIVTSPDVKDAYFSMNDIPGLGRARIGNFFVPFGLEQVTNDTMNAFLERSIPTQGVFTADREVGFALYNCNSDKTVTWTTGMFFDNISDSIKERIDDNQGVRLSGRLTWLPYYDEASKGRYLLHTGVGVLHTEDQDDRVRIRARPQIHEGPRIIDSGNIGADKYTIGNLESAIVYGRLAIQSEGYLAHIERTTADTTFISGAYVHSTYFLTGENRVFEKFGQHGAQFGRNVPINNFSLLPGRCNGIGAWEAKARYSHLNLDNLNAGQYNDFTFGCNWYWNDRVRMMFDWIHPITTQTAVFGSTQSDILASRFDFNW